MPGVLASPAGLQRFRGAQRKRDGGWGSSEATIDTKKEEPERGLRLCIDGATERDLLTRRWRNDREGFGFAAVACSLAFGRDLVADFYIGKGNGFSRLG